MQIRAEHPSLEVFLKSALTPEARRNVLFVSFTQWDFALAALADTAMGLHRMGSELTLAFWTAHTPLRDTGWSASHTLASLTGAPARDLGCATPSSTWGSRAPPWPVRRCVAGGRHRPSASRSR